MKIMNRKAFTLVELLATIVIISLLSGLAAVSYTLIVNQSADKVFTSYEDTMHAEAVYKLTMHYGEVDFTDNVARLSLNDLQIDPINNPNDSSDMCLNSYVDVTKSYVGNVLSIHYKVCLICGNYNSDGSNCRDYEN